MHDRPASQKGRFAIVTDARRDAVDVGGASDEGAFLRTAKSCGPDTPTLVSSSRQGARATVAKKPGAPRRARSSRSTIARGMSGETGVLVVTTLACFLNCMRGCGRIERPAFPAPFSRRGPNEQQYLAQRARGEIAELCPVVIASAESVGW